MLQSGKGVDVLEVRDTIVGPAPRFVEDLTPVSVQE
jgi:hypothetical protein